ncbi:unnamed protein product, partial [Musa acuminata subsp. burmannicoides]
MMQFCCTPLISLRRGVAVVHKRVHVDCTKQEVIMKLVPWTRVLANT